MFRFAPFFQLFANFFANVSKTDSREDMPTTPFEEDGEAEILEDEAFEEPARPGDELADFVPEWIDMRSEAAKAKYRKSGRNKLKRYKRRKAGTMRAVVVHQTGVERKVTSKRYHLVSAHYVIRCDGAILQLFDHDVRLASSNSMDRAPWHAINIEIAGNFEGQDGSGRWWSPETMGRGRATPEQLAALRYLLAKICSDEEGRIELIAPHRSSGRKYDKKKKKWIPNRQICPGSRVWKCAETWAMENAVRVPDEGETFGGLPIEREWRSEAWLERYAA